MKSKFILLLSLFLSLTVTVFAQDSFAKLYPENTGFFIEFNNTEPANKDFDKTAFNQILQHPQMQKFFAHTSKKLDEVFNFASMLTQGAKVDQLLTAFANHVSLGIYAERNQAYALLIAEFPENVDPLRLVSPFNQQGSAAKEFNFSFPLDKNRPVYFVSVKIVGKRLYAVLCSDTTYLNTVLQPPAKSLATNPEYLKASAHIGSDPLLSGYTSPALHTVMLAIISQLNLDLDPALIPEDNFRTMAFGTRIEAPAFVQRLYFKDSMGLISSGLLSKIDQEQLALVPTDSSSFATAGMNIPKLIDFTIKYALSQNPELNALPAAEREKMHKMILTHLDSALEEIRAEYGINPLTDLFGNLDDQITISLQNTANLTGLDLFGFGGLTFNAKVKDKAKLTQALNTCIDRLLPKLEDQVASRLELDSKFGTIKGIALANAFTFCYLITDDDNFILALNPAAIEYTLTQRQAKQNYLNSDKNKLIQQQLAETLKVTGLSGEQIKFAYIEIDGISDFFNNTVALGSSIAGIIFATDESAKLREQNGGQLQFSPIPNPKLNPPAFVQYLADAFPLYLLPSDKVINQYVFDNWQVTYITPEQELITLDYGTFPIGNIFFSKDFGKICDMLQTGGLVFAAIEMLQDDKIDLNNKLAPQPDNTATTESE